MYIKPRKTTPQLSCVTECVDLEKSRDPKFSLCSFYYLNPIISVEPITRRYILVCVLTNCIEMVVNIAIILLMQHAEQLSKLITFSHIVQP